MHTIRMILIALMLIGISIPVAAQPDPGTVRIEPAAANGQSFRGLGAVLGLGQRKVPGQVAVSNLPGCALVPVPVTPGAGQDETVSVVIMGDSQSEETGEVDGVNQAAFVPLLRLARKINPDAFFLVGDLVAGRKPSAKRPDLPVPVSELEGKGAPLFRYQYTVFSDLLRKNLGDGVPFYPLPGNHDTRIRGSFRAFRTHFGIKDSWLIDGRLLARGVTIKGVHFSMMGLEYFDKETQKCVLGNVPDSMLDWLRKDLEKAGKARQRFVLTHEPAFPHTKDQSGGLAVHPKQRDALWTLLRSHGVAAYFCGHMHVYKRSLHDGIWQVITGGAGGGTPNPNKKGHFYHLTHLVVPPAPAPAHVTIYDINGAVRDEFDLPAI